MADRGEYELKSGLASGTYNGEGNHKVRYVAAPCWKYRARLFIISYLYPPASILSRPSFSFVNHHFEKNLAAQEREQGPAERAPAQEGYCLSGPRVGVAALPKTSNELSLLTSPFCAGSSTETCQK